jgi:hypothetical protein
MKKISKLTALFGFATFCSPHQVLANTQIDSITWDEGIEKYTYEKITVEKDCFLNKFEVSIINFPMKNSKVHKIIPEKKATRIGSSAEKFRSSIAKMQNVDFRNFRCVSPTEIEIVVSGFDTQDGISSGKERILVHRISF